MEQPFDASTHFDENLREIPNAPAEMAEAVRLLKEKLEAESLPDPERLSIAGKIGVYARILGDFSTAHRYLDLALALCDQYGKRTAGLVNRLRLAHLYQWERDYVTSNRLFEEVLALCESDPELTDYLDFACQHAGKNRFDQGRYEEAELLFQRALDLRIAKGNEELIASTRLALDTTQRRLGW